MLTKNLEIYKAWKVSDSAYGFMVGYIPNRTDRVKIRVQEVSLGANLSAALEPIKETGEEKGIILSSPVPATERNQDGQIINLEVGIVGINAFLYASNLSSYFAATDFSEKRLVNILDIYPSRSDIERYVKGKVTWVTDGDTIHIKVSEKGSGISDDLVKIGGVAQIRLLGINCPETEKEGSNWQSRNASWLAERGMEPSEENHEMALEMAEEAKKMVTTWLGKDNVIAVVDSKKYEMGGKEYREPATDTYNRLISVVYAPFTNNTDGSAYDAICLNTSLIATPSRVNTEYSLAEPAYKYNLNEEGVLESDFLISGWWRYLPNYDQRASELEKWDAQRKKPGHGRQKFLRDHNLIMVDDQNSGKNITNPIDKMKKLVYNEETRVRVGSETYTVKSGDVISDVAFIYGCSVEQIIDDNNLPPYKSMESDYVNGTFPLVGTTLNISKYETRNTDTNMGLWENDKSYNLNIIPSDSGNDVYTGDTIDDRHRLDGIDPDNEINPYGEHYMRIGDCTFSVPPISISLDSMGSNSRVQSLRTKSSMQINTGHSTNIITVNLFFPNEQAVNGYPFPNPTGKEPYYRNGLRPLVAQFKKAPFLPIENELLNERYKIYSVILKDLEVSTVPGFPGCMQTKLVLEEFDHLPYMPHEEDFASTFCWPLYRWYYQKAMQPETTADSSRTYLKKLNSVDDKITFKLPDEGILAQRQEAIKNMLNKLAPVKFIEENSKAGSIMGDSLNDSLEIEPAKKQYNRFVEVLKKYPKDEYPRLYDEDGVFDPSEIAPILKDAVHYYNRKRGQNFMNLKWEWWLVSTNAGMTAQIYRYVQVLMDILSETYFDGAELNGKAEMYFMINKLNMILNLIEIYTNISIPNAVTGYEPDTLWDAYKVFGSTKLGDVSFLVYGRTLDAAIGPRRGVVSLPVISTYDIVAKKHSEFFNGKERSGGKYVLDIRVPESRLKFKEIYDYGDTVYSILDPADSLVFALLEDNKEVTELSFIDYEMEFDEMDRLAHMGEADIPTVDFPIEDIIIESGSASLHNYFAPLQLNDTESPVYQHLGSSDIIMHYSLRTKSRLALEQFRELMSTAQRLAREYRVAITSGVVTIENGLSSLFGVKSILIERLSIETSGEDKESFHINIDVVAFDKTQRVREELDSLQASPGEIGEDADMDAFYAWNRERRNRHGFDYTIIDFKLKDLEIYPDLELPTYKEVNEILPYLNLKDTDGNPFLYYPNPDGAKFVDPDFYIRCEESMREYLYALLEDGEIMMYMKDGLGLEEITVGPKPGMPMNDPNRHLSEGTKGWLQDNLRDMYIGNKRKETKDYDNTLLYRIDPNGGKNSVSNYTTTDSISATGIQRAARAPKDIPWAIDEEELLRINKEAVSPPPTVEEIIRWGYAENEKRAVLKLRTLRNPTPLEFVDLLTRLVSYYWRDVPSEADLIKSGQTEDLMTYTYGKYSISPKVITQEKIVNLLKALYEHESVWEQFEGELIPKWGKNNQDVGIGQINIKLSGIFRTLDETRRGAYFWEYNLEKAVEYFARLYNYCIDHGPSQNIDAYDNPLDWAIVCYNKGPDQGLDSSSKPDDNTYYRAIRQIFHNKYGAGVEYIAATPTEKSNPELISRYGDVSFVLYTDLLRTNQYFGPGVDIKVPYGEEPEYRQAYGPFKIVELDITKVVEEGGVKKYVIGETERKGVVIYDPYHEIEKSKNFLDTIVDGIRYDAASALRYLIESRIRSRKYENVNFEYGLKWEARYDFDGSFNSEDYYLIIPEGAYEYAQKLASEANNREGGFFDKNYQREMFYFDRIVKIMPMEAGGEEIYGHLNHPEAEFQTIPANIKIVPDDVGSLYHKSFADMLEYDARGRMVRAFPTFQMFIVDEGRAMSWHKLWDNFYGYNSIQSIDIIKDRRMVADTAVVSMTNIYHNLSTYDNETSYGEWDFTLHDLIGREGNWFGNDGSDKNRFWKTLWDFPDKDILRARREQLDTMMLKAGARINLRVGYGSNAYRLPTVFNGTVTELDTGETITLLAQGDGIELTNKLKVRPKETSLENGLLKGRREPREMMAEMLSAKGKRWNNFWNKASQGLFYKDHPLGISHFGDSDVGAILRDQFGLNMGDRHENYGEVAQNIYSSSGIQTMSQWIYTEGENEGEMIKGRKWDGIIPVGMGDEPNINVSLFDKTPWDVVQIYAHCAPDYIATVLPFEYRSTIFFGKPWWSVIDRYQYEYRYDEEKDMFVKIPTVPIKKTLSQFRLYTGMTDIIGNNIVATEEYMYTNVIGVWNEREGPAKQTETVSIDSDIYPDKQTTAMVHLPLEKVWIANKWTQERYALSAATAALRDYAKEMYQGELIVIGDPTVKPYDTMYITDSHTDMNGLASVKRVCHHFGMDTGFITTISPDCISIVDDARGIDLAVWGHGALAGASTFLAGVFLRNHMWKSLWSAPIGAGFRKFGKWTMEKTLVNIIGKMGHATESELETLLKYSGDISEYIKTLVQPYEKWSDSMKALFKNGVRQTGVLDEAIKKDLATILSRNETLGKIGDGFLGKTSEFFGKIIKAGGEKGGIGKLVDNLWDSTEVLKTGKLFKNAEKGFIRGVGNTIHSPVSKLVKFGIKKGGNTVAASIRGMSKFFATIGKIPILKTTLVGLAIDAGMAILSNSISEKINRFLRNRQALVLIPLKYRGKSFTAGINGHQGSVIGDDPSRIDKFFMGQGFAGGLVTGVYEFFGVDSPDYKKEYSEALNEALWGE